LSPGGVRSLLRSPSYRTQLWLMLLPFLGGTLLLVALPALLSAGLAFTTYDALGPPVWTGFANLRFVLSDPLTGIAVGNTIWFVATAVPLRVLGALLLALLLSRERRGVGGYRSAVYLPTVNPRRRVRAHLAVGVQPAVRAGQRHPGVARPAHARLGRGRVDRSLPVPGDVAVPGG